ncbi:MAG: hypothetical protein ABIQ01_05660 [Pseudolysinimonas sp.]
MAEIGFDFSSLNTLAADLGELAAEVIPNVEKAVEVTARHIKDDWRDEAKKRNPAHARAYPYSVDYDMENKDGAISAQIGPNLGKNQGSLGILEEASGDVRAAPQGNARRAVRNNLADFEKGLLKAAGTLA